LLSELLELELELRPRRARRFLPPSAAGALAAPALLPAIAPFAATTSASGLLLAATEALGNKPIESDRICEGAGLS